MAVSAEEGVDPQAGELYTTDVMPAFTDDSSDDADASPAEIEPARRPGMIYALNPAQR